MAEIRPIVINLLLVSLFAVAIITAGVMIAIQNGASNSITDDSAFSNLKDNLISSLEENSENTEAVNTAFQNSSVTLTSGIPFVDAIYGTWKVIKSAPSTMYNLIVGVIFSKILGGDATYIIISVISAILIITIIFAVIKLISTGEGG